MNKRVIIITIQIFVCAFCFAQSKKIDSLKKVLPSLSNTARVDCLNQLGSTYQDIQTDSALFYSNQALNESNSIQYAEGVSEASFAIGLSSGERGDYKTAEQNFRLS